MTLPPPRKIRRLPHDEQSRLMVKIARMYHERGLKQAEIAHELHITQARVSRLLRRAVQSGVVSTVVVSPPGVHTELEEKLENRFGLAEAVVVDTMSSDERDVAQNLGAAAAGYLESTLLGNEVVGISSWSANLLATATFMRSASNPVVTDVVQLVGGVGDPRVQVEANRLLTTFAHATGATPIFLPAPGLLGSAAAQRSLMSDPAVENVSKRWSELTTALVGIGALEPSPLLASSGNGIAVEDQKTLRALGAVGDICLRFFDKDGVLVAPEMDERVIGIRPDQLLAVPRRIAVAGGTRKLGALRGVLLGGWVTVLITDLAAAQELCNDTQARVIEGVRSAAR
ncbi:sugar-binding transcriptional regulator [Rhodococcus sp. NPDC057297]|uniref:sugar-binding transcriptional regulator n=1 Tax=Rhodococcus sp. NPDC057297 TaxID=3346090 RepID=UPI003645CF75